MRPGPNATSAGPRIVCDLCGWNTCHIAHRPTPLPPAPPSAANSGTMAAFPNDRPRRPAISTTPAHALATAAHLDRRADLLLAEGQHEQAERLSHMAHGAREQAREVRA